MEYQDEGRNTRYWALSRHS